MQTTDLPRSTGPSPDAAQALAAALAASGHAREAGSPVPGAEAAERALALARILGDRLAAARATTLLAAHLLRQGHHQRLVSLAVRALPKVDALGTLDLAIDLRNNLSLAYCRLSDCSSALNCVMIALKQAQELGRPGPLSRSLNVFGLVYAALGDNERAMDMLARAVTAAEDDGGLEVRFAAQVNLAIMLSGIARRQRYLGDPEAARAWARPALEALQAAAVLARGNPQREMYCSGNESVLHEHLGDLPAMKAAVDRSKVLAAQLGLPHFLAKSNLLHAGWLFASGRAEEACTWLETQVDVSKLDDDYGRRRLYETRYNAYKAAGRPAQALQALENLLAFERHESNQRIEAQSHALLREAEVQSVRQEADWLRTQTQALEAQAAEANHAAQRDALTGLANRRALDNYLSTWLKSSGAGPDGELAAAMIDIDHFKAINDNYGHEAGDSVLRDLARLLTQELRPGDFVARNGGEEFVLLISGLALDAASVACERLRQRVVQYDWSACVPGPPVTISIGLTAARPEDDVSNLLRRADMAMYRAKHEGRNRLVVD